MPKFQSQYGVYRLPSHEAVLGYITNTNRQRKTVEDYLPDVDFRPWFRDLHTSVMEAIIYGDASATDDDPLAMLFAALMRWHGAVRLNFQGGGLDPYSRMRALAGATHIGQPWLFHRILELLAVWNGPDGWHINMSKLAPAYFDLVYVLATFLVASNGRSYQNKATASLLPDGVPLV